MSGQDFCQICGVDKALGIQPLLARHSFPTYPLPGSAGQVTDVVI